MWEIVYASIISGVFAVICIITLHFSWVSKLKWNVKVEEIKHDKEIKVARIKQPKPKYKRMPKNWIDQMQTAMELLGNDKVQELLGVFEGREEEVADNKVLSTLLELGRGFMEGVQQGQQQQEQQSGGGAY